MRVGLVCPYSLARPGGVQNHVLGLAGHLVAAGHDAHVLAPGRPAPGQLAAHGLSEAAYTSTGRAVPVPANGSTARIAAGPVTAARVRRWLRRVAPDVLHLHEPITPSAALHALGAVAPGTAVVATYHSVADPGPARDLAGRVLARALDRIDVHVAVSETAAETVRGPYRVDPRIVSNGFSVGEFAGGPLDHAPPRVTFLGRVDEPRKGLDTLLAAVPAIVAAAPGVEVLAAGPGRRRLSAPVVRLGALTDADRARLLRRSAVVVAPNTGQESFGLVLVEAMASGVPVVASDLASFRAVVTDETGRVHARLVRPGDPAALGRGVVAALAEPGDVRAAAAHVARFDWSRVGPQVTAAYADARSRRGLGWRG